MNKMEEVEIKRNQRCKHKNAKVKLYWGNYFQKKRVFMWTERPGGPPVGWCPISNGDKPTKREFLLGFEKCGVATRKCFGIT